MQAWYSFWKQTKTTKPTTTFVCKPIIFSAMIILHLYREQLTSWLQVSTMMFSKMWLISLLVTSWSISCFWFCAKFFKFDRLTWDPATVIFSMIISVGNPRNPERLGESITLFFTLIMVGFFFGSELVMNLTTVSIKNSVERPTETWNDLQSNKLTLVYFSVPENDEYAWKNMKKVRYIQIRTNLDNKKYFRQILRFKNISLTSQLEIMCGNDVPQRLVLSKGKVHVRLSKINEKYVDYSYRMKPNRPWLSTVYPIISPEYMRVNWQFRLYFAWSRTKRI